LKLWSKQVKADRSYMDESYLTDEKIMSNVKPFIKPNVKYVYQMPQDRGNKRNLRYTPQDNRDDDEFTPKAGNSDEESCEGMMRH